MNILANIVPDFAEELRDWMVRPLFVMLVGLPGSGKSYFREKYGKRFTILSSDDLIEDAARAHGKTYSEMFDEHSGTAMVEVGRRFVDAVEWSDWIMWDQTNLSRKKRRSVLGRLPPIYRKVAVYFEIEEGLRQERLASRPGKIIPPHEDARMLASYVRPDRAEGWDHTINAERLL